MSNPVKQSLEDNKAEILQNLPEEFHKDFDASLADAAPEPQLSGKAAEDAVIAELKANPDVDDGEWVYQFRKDPQIGQQLPPLSEEALAEEESSALKHMLAEHGLSEVPKS